MATRRLHFIASKDPGDGRHTGLFPTQKALCSGWRARVDYVRGTANVADVTCARCLAKLAKQLPTKPFTPQNENDMTAALVASIITHKKGGF